MPLKSDKISKALLKKGFIKNNKDHKFYEYYINGKQVLHTKLSHGATHDVKIHLIGLMSRQCKLSKNDFLDLINCPLSKEKYKQLIKAQGLHL
ncbi:MAG: hypothetical protein GXO88_14375 [Chlorobi bacterium]|nr:hypothetical protein [Chlorobiota bacterium]